MLVSTLAACGGDDSSEPVLTAGTTSATASAATVAPTPSSASLVPAASAPATQPTIVSSTVPASVPQTWIEVADGRLAFTLALPDEHPVINALEHDLAGDGSCVAPVWQLAGGINVEAWPLGCDPANSEPGNGSFGHYRTRADAPSPVDPIDVDTVLGPGEVFGQTYVECTNSCDEWELDIAVITLSEPVNQEYPTLTVIGTVKSYTRDDLLALLESFGAG
jgi:hypothetical protein